MNRVELEEAIASFGVIRDKYRAAEAEFVAERRSICVAIREKAERMVEIDRELLVIDSRLLSHA